MVQFERIVQQRPFTHVDLTTEKETLFAIFYVHHMMEWTLCNYIQLMPIFNAVSEV
jgi:hypothetical protein